ncbi:hypothetical protein [Curtobacterium sp. MCSS17_016]|uniref:hypothetical protein n=1 Tax=Curtobacterium sp. MCSS17_016 TaxID=2175644 RepID=UPI0015E8BC88|nr:hypothetical protein [Curtobacterium sp. MCSS17_016]WIE81271.1 hypothetical protein DEJ19_018735 [Curtobacterium sp. MCSS17_016]
MHDDPTLDCQTCGEPVRVLTYAEQQQVAANPYNYVVYCRQHLDDAIQEGFR